MDRYFSKRCYIGNELRAARRTTAFGVVVASLGIVIVGSFAFGASPSSAAPSITAPSAGDKPVVVQTDHELGRRLFEQNWKHGTSPSDDRDGLGPFFNDRSCVACHSQGGVGGAGSNLHNIDILSVVVPEQWQTLEQEGPIKDKAAEQIARRALFDLNRSAGSLHSGLSNSTSTILHRHGTDPRYLSFRARLLSLSGVLTSSSQDAPPTEPDAKRPILKVTRRHPTALFGAGVIDRISKADIAAVAAQQPSQDDQVSGRIAGRFGWRGQTADLASFVKGACSAELGLSLSGLDEPENPVTATERIKKDRGIVSSRTSLIKSATDEGRDLSDDQFKLLVDFVATLPLPVRRVPTDEKLAAEVKSGESLFAASSCAVCHRPTLGIAGGIYSDLLLHDMGAGLEDQQAAPRSSLAIPGRSSGYYDSLSYRLNPGERRREWRTPPLWGVADSAPYLHDGRAPNLDTAITMHGGEATRSVEKYRALSEEDRARLLAFLGTLAAPEPLPPLEPEPKKRVAARSP